MSVDRIHITFLAAVWIAGIVSMVYTIPKVNKIRRLTYFVAIPVWLFFAATYGYAAWMYEAETVSPMGAAFRIVFGLIALEGLLVPYVDRLETRPQQIHVVVEDSG